jgi:hypothetical protein
VSGLAPPREWDASAIAEAPELAALDALELDFVVLPGGSVVGDLPPAAGASLIENLALAPPFRARAVRRGEQTWAVGAVTIQITELPADTEGKELMLTVNEQGERELVVDGRPSLVDIEPLARLAEGRHEAFVLRAERLQGRLWEFRIDPL